MEDDMAGSIQPLMRFFIPMKKMAAALSELVRGFFVLVQGVMMGNWI